MKAFSAHAAPLARQTWRFGALSLAALAALWLASCTSPGPKPPTELPPETEPAPESAVAGTLQRPKSQWVPTSFSELPGWGQDDLSQWWPALRQSCNRPAAGWQRACAQVQNVLDVEPASAKLWLENTFQVYRLQTPQGENIGLMTGYYEPSMRAVRQSTAQHKTPLHQPPSDLATRQPYWTRQQLDTLPAAQAALKGREIAWLDDPLDVLVLQIQGSGRLTVREPDGREQLVRVSYVAHNGHPYRSVGRWLIDQGALKPSEASWQGIKDWAKRNPKRVKEMLWQNPRVVFFNETPLTNPDEGPRGAQAVPLTPARSIAVDPGSVPYGTPIWIDSTDPKTNQPLQRLVMAQDTGGAITGAVRADYFWGWTGEAEAQAGRTRQPLRMWALWPK